MKTFTQKDRKAPVETAARARSSNSREGFSPPEPTEVEQVLNQSSRAQSLKQLQRMYDRSSLVTAQAQRAESLSEGSRTASSRQPFQRAENRTGLPDELKAGVEALSGMSMDNVRVHYNSSRPAQLSAVAYAQGTDIHIGPRQEQHLPHEAWHVVQQAQGRVKPTMEAGGGVPVNDEQGLEAEADVMGARAMTRADDLAGDSAVQRVVNAEQAQEEDVADSRGVKPLQRVWGGSGEDWCRWHAPREGVCWYANEQEDLKSAYAHADRGQGPGNSAVAKDASQQKNHGRSALQTDKSNTGMANQGEIIQAKITYDAQSGFGKNRMRPGWLGALKTAFAGAKALWKSVFGGSDVSHIMSFDAIQDELVYACENDDSSEIKGMLERFFDDDEEIEDVKSRCDELDGARGADKVSIANGILSKLNSSTQNTRHGHSAINRGIGKRFDPQVEKTGKGRYQLTTNTLSFVRDAIENREDIRERRGGTTTVRLRRTSSKEGFYTSDLARPLPYKYLIPRHAAMLSELNESDSDSDDGDDG